MNMDPRACDSNYLKEGMLVLYSKTEINDDEETWSQGIIERLRKNEEFPKYGHEARFTNGDIGFIKQILDVDKITFKDIIELVAMDENQNLEFKETFSVDNKTGDKLKCLKDATVKEVAAFMNTVGGTILIGVSNDKKIIGIERDLSITNPDPEKKETREDYFLRSVEQQIHIRLQDPNISPTDFHIQLVSGKENGDEKTVCVIQVKKLKKPIFMDVEMMYTECGTNKQIKNKKQIFYIRTPDSKVREKDGRNLLEHLENN